MESPAPPSTLDSTGALLWDAVVGKYDLRADELVTLEDWCSLADEIAELREEWVAQGKPRTTKGSMGQLVDHPLPKRMTDLRMKRNTLAKQLNLPDEPGGVRPNQQRDAANSRWAAAHGQSA